MISLFTALRGFNRHNSTFAASGFNPLKLDASLEAHGCALITGLFDPAKLATFDRRIARNMEGLDRAISSRGLPTDIANYGLPIYFAEDIPTDAVHKTYCESHPAMFDPARMGGLPCASLIDYVFSKLRDTGINKVISDRLKLPRLCTSPAVCHIRVFPPIPKELIAEKGTGLALHQDNRLYNNAEFDILNLWFPMRYEHGAMASLEFVPTGKRELLPTATGCEIDKNMFPRKAYWSPAYELGDAVLISGYVPHKTYYPPGISKERTSADIRFFAVDVPGPVMYES